MAVPAHDERDFAFAKRYDLPIMFRILPEKLQNKQESAFDLEDGKTPYRRKSEYEYENEKWFYKHFQRNSDETISIMTPFCSD